MKTEKRLHSPNDIRHSEAKPIIPQRPPYLSIALISAGSLAYEILLMRLFSIIQWHHFAYMIIALALLGYGISGTLAALAAHLVSARYCRLYISCLLLFGLSAPGCFFAAQLLPFNAEEIFWDGRQVFYLLSIFLLLAIPFFFAASAVCITLMKYRQQIASIYAIDLAGAGLGSLGIILLLYRLFPVPALIVIGCSGIVAALLACWELQRHNRLALSLGLVTLLGCLVLTGLRFELKISVYKSLQQKLRVSGTKVIAQRSSPLGLISVLSSAKVPLRYVPGLSLMATQEAPEQLGLFTDADSMSVITRTPAQLQDLQYLDQITSALPYHLGKQQRVSLIGVGGGSDILQAQLHHVPYIAAVEMNPQLITLLQHDFHDFTGGLYQQPHIHWYNGEARDFFSRNPQHYDMIQLALLDTFNASSSGLYALNESYLYTVEALKLYIQHLNPNGYLSITRWIKIPPRDTLKLFATAIAALQQSGRSTPEQYLALIRGWQTSTLLVKKSVFNQHELKAIAVFASTRGFDLAYLPGLQISAANRFNILQQPYFYMGATALLGAQRNRFIEQYKFNIAPASDDRPYFHHFFKWPLFPEWYRLRNKGGMSLLEAGYMVFIATLLIAVFCSILLVLVPLRFLPGGSSAPECSIPRHRVISYFLLIGLAFLFIEIAFMQRFILFLHQPIFATAVTLTAFLVFAGLGSHYSARMTRNFSIGSVIAIAILGICSLSGLYLLLLDSIFKLLTAIPITLKIVISILLIAPLAVFMGMPFPLALSSLSEHARPLLPWAWGINGCASVISAVLATLLAIHFGFSCVILFALLLYITALFNFPVPVFRPADKK